MTRGTITSGPFNLAYSIEGTGPSALVIGSATYYPRTFSDNLRKHLKLAFVDHRGFAPAPQDAPISEYSLDIVLADMELARQRLNLGRIIVIGHSGHGYMALEYAKRYPEHVSHVVMIATGPSHSAYHSQISEQHWQEAVCPERKQQLERDLALLPSEITAAPEKRFITFCLRLGAKSWFDPAYDATPLWKDVHVNMPMFDHMWGEVFRDIDIAKDLDKLQAPVLLALGRFDYLVAPYSTWAPYRDKFRDLTIRVFDRSSHTPQLEESETFDSQLLAWLAR